MQSEDHYRYEDLMTVKPNIGLRQISLSAEDRCNRIRVITKVFVKSDPILLNCQSTRIGDAVRLKKFHQFKLLQRKEIKKTGNKFCSWKMLYYRRSYRSCLFLFLSTFFLQNYNWQSSILNKNVP